MKLLINSIGIVQSKVEEAVDEKWGDVISEIHIDDQYSDGLHGIESFSHAIIICYLHLSNFNKEEHLKRRPQDREDMPLVGIFSQRAKHRPNPIGVTSVEILGVRDNVLIVKGLDVINGTPVLDIKPYYPIFDCRNNAVVPEWVEKLMEQYF